MQQAHNDDMIRLRTERSDERQQTGEQLSAKFPGQWKEFKATMRQRDNTLTMLGRVKKDLPICEPQVDENGLSTELGGIVPVQRLSVEQRRFNASQEARKVTKRQSFIKHFHDMSSEPLSVAETSEGGVTPKVFSSGIVDESKIFAEYSTIMKARRIDTIPLDAFGQHSKLLEGLIIPTALA